MTSMRFLLLFSTFLLSLLVGFTESAVRTSAYTTATPANSKIVPCDVSAFVIDQDPQGLNVRSGPGKSYARVGNLPYKQDTGVSVHITGSSGDWVQIDSATEEGGDEEQAFFKGTGWVYAPLLGLTGTAQSKGATLLYRAASQKTVVVKRVPGGDDVKVWGCRGTWLYVEYEKVKGWAAPKTLCSNSLTTCV